MPWALCNTSSSILRADIVWKVSPQLDILFLGMISKKLLSLTSRSSEDLQHFVLFFRFPFFCFCRKLLKNDILTDQHVQAVTVSVGLPREMRGSWAEARLVSMSIPGWCRWKRPMRGSIIAVGPSSLHYLKYKIYLKYNLTCRLC